MPLFGARTRRSSATDWLSVAMYADRVDVAQIERRVSGRPVVHLCESYATKDAQTETLKAIARGVRPHRFRCTAMLNGADYQIQLVEAPNVPAAELKSAVRWKLKDLLDYPVDAATIDIANVPTDSSGAARSHYVYAV